MRRTRRGTPRTSGSRRRRSPGADPDRLPTLTPPRAPVQVGGYGLGRLGMRAPPPLVARRRQGERRGHDAGHHVEDGGGTVALAVAVAVAGQRGWRSGGAVCRVAPDRIGGGAEERERWVCGEAA